MRPMRKWLFGAITVPSESQTMLQELKAVSDHLTKEGNDDLKQSIYRAFLEDPERGAEMIIAFAREKEVQLDASPENVLKAIQHIGDQISEDDLADIELTPEQLAVVSGGAGGLIVGLFGILFMGGGLFVQGRASGIW